MKRRAMQGLLLVYMLFQSASALSQGSESQASLEQFNITLKRASQSLCACLEKPYSLMQNAMIEIKRSERLGNKGDIQKIQLRLQQGITEAQPCIQNLSRQFPQIDRSQTLQDRLLATVAEQCPNPLSKP